MSMKYYGVLTTRGAKDLCRPTHVSEKPYEDPSRIVADLGKSRQSLDSQLPARIKESS